MPNDSAPDDPTQADPPAFQSDRLLLAGVASRQPAALTELYERCFPSAYALAVRMLRDPQAAEACVQTVFLALWQHPPGGDSAPPEWSVALFAAVHQQARAQQRAPSRPSAAPAVPAPPVPAAIPPPGSGRFAARLHLAAQRQAAQTALATLPPRQRMILERVYFDGETVAQVAAALGESRATITGHLCDGLRQVDTALTAARPLAAPAAPPPLSPAAGPPAAGGPATGPLVAALARMHTAQQHAADVRYHARAVQQQAHQAQQHAATVQQRADTTLRQLQGLHDLYRYLALQLQAGAILSEEDCAQTEGYLATHPQAIDVTQVAAVLALLHVRSDAEVYRLLPSLIS
ncbi:MAG: RNA polymerase sigma factor [Chloroflexia bacterium]